MIIDTRKIPLPKKASLLTFISILILSGFIISCDDDYSTKPGDSNFNSSPSNQEIIDTVISYLQGKTYIDSIVDTQTSQVPCSQVDYDTDAFKNSPNERCKGSGGYGFGYKTITERVSKEIQKNCPLPPPADSPVWQVSTVEENSWLVSNNFGQWFVIKDESGYRIEPRQKC